MSLGALSAIFQSIGGIVGVLLTLITFFGIITKKPKEKFRAMIREESKEANKETFEKVKQIEAKIESNDKTDAAILRNAITEIYFHYQDKKEIPHYQKENVLYLYEQYEKLGGNSYIQNVVAEIKAWKELV